MAFTGQLQVDFVHDPTSASFTWVDITSRGLTANYRRGRSYERNQVEAGGGTVKLRNDDGALDPTNGSSTYSPNVLPFRRFQHNVTVTGPGTVPIYTGLVERWPQEWETGYGTSPVQVVDIFAWLSLAKLRSAVQQEIIADSPYVYMPLTDDSSTTSPALVVASAGTFGTMVQSKYLGSTFAFGSGTPLTAEGVGTLQMTPGTGGGWCARAYPVSVPIVSGGVAQTVTLRVNCATADPTGIIASLRDDPATSYLELDMVTAGAVRAQLWSAVSGGVTVTGPAINDSLPHDLACVLTSTGGTNLSLALWVDGVQVATGTGSGQPDLTAASFSVGGVVTGIGTVTGPFTGSFAHAAVFKGTANLANHYNAGANGFAGETADTRIARILRYIGWTPTTALDACTTTMLAADLAGKDALSAIQDVQASEGGVFFASKAGVLTYKSRRTRMQTTTSAATFGESTSGGEVPYVNMAFDFDPTYVYNDVQITRTGSGKSVSASSATSRAHYGQRTLALTIGTQSDSEALDEANWLLNVNLAPHMRVRSVTIDCLATPGAWAAVLPLEIGSRVTVKKRPSNGTTITASTFVESIGWDIVDSSRALCTLELSPIPLQALIADDATYGICDSTFVAAW